jgi:hypothetical protein
MAHKNGKVMTQEEHKMLAKMLLMQAAEIERLWDIVYELKLDAIAAGRPVPDASKWEEGNIARKRGVGIDQLQRDKLWKSLGLDDD